MNFEQRARKARDRGQPVRAAVLLIEGLKRNPDETSAVSLLGELYVEELTSAGLGYDLVDVLALQPDCQARLIRLLRQLHERQKDSMGRELVRAAGEQGIAASWPPSPPVPADPQPDEPQIEEPAAEEGPAPRPEPAQPELPAAEEEPAVAKDPPPREEPAAEEEPAEEEPAREVDEPAQTEEPADAPAPHKETSRADSSTSESSQPEHKPPETAATGRPARRRLMVVAVVVVALVGLGAYVMWEQGDQWTDGGDLDQRMAQIDPADKSQIEALFGGYGSPDTLIAPVAERRVFMRAVHAADWGEESASVASKDSAWGIAAAATSSALQGSFEQAMADAARLERRHPNALASLWARGFVDEARGRYASAVRHYQSGHERFPQFAPFVVGQLRIHARQGRIEAVERLQSELAELSPDNPYVAMPNAIPTLDELAPRSTSEVDEDPTPLPEAAPKFVRAFGELELAVEAIGGADYDQALVHAEAALDREPRLGPALLVAGGLRAAKLDVKTSTSAFTRLIELPGLTSTYRWMVQIVAPRALLGAGRADLAYPFVPPVKSAGRVTDPGQAKLAQPVVPLLSIEQKLADEPLARQALLCRVEVLSALGYEQAALESLELLGGDLQELAGHAALARTLLAVRRGSRRDARSAARSVPVERGGGRARAALAFYRGRYEDAIDHARAARSASDGPDDLATLRFLALSLTGDNRGREALSVLDTAQVSVIDRAGLDALRMRVLGRVGAGVDGSTSPYERFKGLEPTALDRLLDLAEVAFWQKQFDQARDWAQQAASIAPQHPEANWLLGLIAQIGGRAADAKQRFRAAWREDPNDPTLLIELGQIYLGLDEASRAQKAFYRALLRDRSSVEALRGLGEAYLRFDRRIGKRDLSRILRGYQGSTRYVAQSAETLKWLAILHGSRGGKEEGLGYLDRAAQVVGESAEILIERARYRQARKEHRAARKLYARALEKNATLAQARLGLARMALVGEDVDVARTQLQRYLSLAPDAEDADWARQKLDELEAGSLADAE